MSFKEEIRQEFLDEFIEKADLVLLEEIFEWFYSDLLDAYLQGYEDAKDDE